MKLFFLLHAVLAFSFQSDLDLSFQHGREDSVESFRQCLVLSEEESPATVGEVIEGIRSCLDPNDLDAALISTNRAREEYLELGADRFSPMLKTLLFIELVAIEYFEELQKQGTAKLIHGDRSTDLYIDQLAYWAGLYGRSIREESICYGPWTQGCNLRSLGMSLIQFSYFGADDSPLDLRSLFILNDDRCFCDVVTE
jgi:hypothetical protein